MLSFSSSLKSAIAEKNLQVNVEIFISELLIICENIFFL